MVHVNHEDKEMFVGEEENEKVNVFYSLVMAKRKMFFKFFFSKFKSIYSGKEIVIDTL